MSLSLSLVRHRLFLLTCLAGGAVTACADEELITPSGEEIADGARGSAMPTPSIAPAPVDASKFEEPRRDVGPGIESQCGPSWDAQPVETYNGGAGIPTYFVARHESRVGYHVEAGCSGTLISDDLFLSAGHCGYAVGNTVRFDYQNAPNGTARTTRDFPVTQVVEQENAGAWDYAIVRLGNSPGREYGHAAIAAIDPPAGSTVTIIGHPARRPKEIHAGPVLDYSSTIGANWFRHQVDTVGGNSGSGVLNANGQLVGVHTNAGCNTGNPVEGNSAMRMSQLVPHSPTLQALTRAKVLWRHTSGEISLWTVDAAGNYLSNANHAPGASWTPLSYSNNRLLWRNSDGRISYWTLNDANQHLTFAENGPYAGWTAVNHASDRVLWRSTTGEISLWTVNSVGNYVSHVNHGPFAGWTAVNYANNHILWRHDTGKISLWRVDDAGTYLGHYEYGPYAGWTALSYENGEILWRHTDGRTSLWTMNRAGAGLAYAEHGPIAGWTAVGVSDRKQLWRDGAGKLSLWTVNSYGSFLSYVEHGPFAGWVPLLTSGGRP